MTQTTDPAGDFLDAYGKDTKALACRYRNLIKEQIPGIWEQPDVSARIIGYGFGPKYGDTICTLIASKKGLKLGFYKGSELPDPDKLLAGSGKIHRYVALKHKTPVAAVSVLLTSAYAAYKKGTHESL